MYVVGGRTAGEHGVSLTPCSGSGEETGALETMLRDIAECYEGTLDLKLTRMTTGIEPVLLLAMGVIVGTIVVILYVPVLQMASTIHSSPNERVPQWASTLDHGHKRGLQGVKSEIGDWGQFLTLHSEGTIQGDRKVQTQELNPETAHDRRDGDLDRADVDRHSGPVLYLEWGRDGVGS
jgi:hypothetical protein